jgi:hypothetical protein
MRATAIGCRTQPCEAGYTGGAAPLRPRRHPDRNARRRADRRERSQLLLSSPPAAVVTSNKWPVALHGLELVELARGAPVKKVALCCDCVRLGWFLALRRTLLGRVTSADTLVAYGAIPLGSLAAGLLLSSMSARTATLVLAAGMVALAAAATASRSIRTAPTSSSIRRRRHSAGGASVFTATTSAEKQRASLSAAPARPGHAREFLAGLTVDAPQRISRVTDALGPR